MNQKYYSNLKQKKTKQKKKTFVCNFLIVSNNTCFSLCLVEPKVGNFLNFNFDTCQLRGCFIQPPESIESAGDSCVFLVYFAVLSLVFE